MNGKLEAAKVFQTNREKLLAAAAQRQEEAVAEAATMTAGLATG